MADTTQHPAPAPQTRLDQLAEAHGVGTTFKGWDGEPARVAPETLVTVLGALGVDASSDAAVGNALAEVEAGPWRSVLPAVVVVRQSDADPVRLHVPVGSDVDFWAVDEDGVRYTGMMGDAVGTRYVDGQDIERREGTLPHALPLGWHTIHASVDGVESSCTLVVTPDRLSTTAALMGGRTWGLMAQLYSVRSSASWGIGDLADLGGIARAAAEHGGGFVLVNPLHAAEPKPPVEPSPYLPTTRRFFHPLYLRIEDIPEHARLDDAARRRVEELAAGFGPANRTTDLLDRDSAYAAKLEALELVYAVELPGQRQQDFDAYRTHQGQGLADFALWSALAETLQPGAPEWDDVGRPGSDGARALAEEYADRIGFHEWLQWLIDEQLQEAQLEATGAGMAIGVVHDLAVGVHPSGADAWALQDVLATGISVGAPPDMFNQHGQDWSQPPWHPERLAEAGYRPFRDMLRNILRHAGGIRVDHILGLFRLWWIPQRQAPSAGAYVYYDHRALIGILALEAERAGAVVIGEDLGVFEPGVQEYLAERGIFGTSILWFEQDEDGPLPPESYRQGCLTTVTVHDLPPSAGYLAGEHVKLRDRLGLLSRPVEEEQAEDRAVQEKFLSLLRSRGLLPAGAVSVQQTVEALHAFIAETPSVLLGVALADAVGEQRTQNQPGTNDEYPNWRIPLADADGAAVLVDDLARNERFASLVAALGPATQGADPAGSTA
ncbi:4-alpha-glucanotransferase [Arthrobacter agilis]|uniref:4-alpha-glucanotransferase n=1 Tax=Arthrobacter agilis TaxID=37921 RepID=UPI000B35763E|nr:4-alpha-glucanotransferase [Arthrobacter agilis]OUM43202.1 4-alpha-glucanotransferase [Arthrobacter agilis]PPB47684.1 4-alpha-glucanotransferase [Arthrobacter agilis]TPV25686.1 4-alpha-glucanotransferase [Arthrobacter agilis]VDR33471.1 4-alpha-glucanotransferase [Arthrobacter agilis]